jgi:hypothetical protein
MKYEQYLQWRARVSSTIAEKIEGLRPKPSDYVTVLDKAIGIDPFQVEPTPTPEPTWEYILNGSIRSSDGQLLPEREAARFSRAGAIIQNSLFWENTEVIDTGPPENFVRTRTLFFRMTSNDQFNPETGLGIYHGGLRLTLGLYSTAGNPDPATAPIVRTYRVDVARNVVSQLITPPEVGIFEARIVSVERL